MSDNTIESVQTAELSTVTGGANRPEGNEFGLTGEGPIKAAPGAQKPGKLLPSDHSGTAGRIGLGASPFHPEGPGNTSY